MDIFTASFRWLYVNASIYAVSMLPSEFFRATSIACFMEYYTQDKNPRRPVHTPPLYQWVRTCLLKDLSSLIIPSTVSISIWFPLQLFAFEVIFDIVHYAVHRLCHMYHIPWHDVHHSIPNPPTVFDTYVIHPLDLFLSYTCAAYIAAWCVPIYFPLVAVYLTYQELGGHLGKHMAPTSCFPLCIWLPKWIGIELYTEDHTRHHELRMYNYGKRFSFMDRLFGTYKC